MTEAVPLQAYPVDPGGQFDSDLHRRVCGHLPHDDGDEATPDSISADDLATRLNADASSLRLRGKGSEAEFVPWTVGDLEQLLAELEGDGFAARFPADGDRPERWYAGEAGIEALTGPALTQVEKLPDGSSKRVEPPPMEGARLEQAEAVNAEAEAEIEDFEKAAAQRRLEIAEQELDAARANAEEAGA